METNTVKENKRNTNSKYVALKLTLMLLPSACFSFHFWLKRDFPKHGNLLILSYYYLQITYSWLFENRVYENQNVYSIFLLLFSNWEEQ